MANRKLKDEKSYLWLAPLLAGSFFAIGYGLSKRILILTESSQYSNNALFEQETSFPGTSLRDFLTSYDSKTAKKVYASDSEEEGSIAQNSSSVDRAARKRKFFKSKQIPQEIEAALYNLKAIPNNALLDSRISEQSYEKLPMESFSNAENSLKEKTFTLLFKKLEKQ